MINHIKQMSIQQRQQKILRQVHRHCSLTYNLKFIISYNYDFVLALDIVHF